MDARGLWETPSCRRRLVASSPRVALLHLLVGKDEQNLGKKSRGGRCPRGLIEGVFLSNTGTCSPRTCVKSPFSCVVKMHVSGVSSWSVILECHVSCFFDQFMYFFRKKSFLKNSFYMDNHKRAEPKIENADKHRKR